MEAEVPAVDITKIMPDVGLHKSVQEIWQEDLLFDFTIEVGDKEFRVHKVIMASVSDYFRAMLTGGMLESKTNRVKLHGLNSLALSNIIEYIYTNEVKSTKASSVEMLACAVYLQIPCAIKAATRLLGYEVNKTNCFDIRTTFQSYALMDAVAHSDVYIKSNFDEILKVYDFNKLSHESIQSLIKLSVGSEWDLFLTVKDWVEADFDSRKQHLDELMQQIRFSLMTSAEVRKIMKMNMYSSCKGSWCRAVEEGWELVKLPIHRKMTDDVVQVIEDTEVRGEPVPVCFSSETKMMYTKLQTNHTWDGEIKMQSMPSLPKGAAAAVQINNFLVVCGHYSGSQKWHIFDARTLLWSRMASTNTPRADFAIAHDHRHIYVLGGRIGLGTDLETITDSIEKFDSDANLWRNLDMKLPTPLHKHTACNAFGTLYVTGGWETTAQVGDCSTRLDSFKMGHKKEGPWIRRAPLVEAFPSLVMQLMMLDGLEVIVVISEDFLLQYYNTETDQWSVWDCKPHMSHRMLWCEEYSRVVADEDDNCIYFLFFLRHPEDALSDTDGTALYPCYCVKWELCSDTRHFTELELTYFPIWKFDIGNAISGVLKIQPPSLRKNTALAAAAAAAPSSTRRYNLRKSRTGKK